MGKRTLIGALIFVLLTSLGFSFSFGGGGPSIYYFPGGTFVGGLKNLNLPIVAATALSLVSLPLVVQVWRSWGFYNGGLGWW